MRTLRFILLWFGTVTLFALYGWFSYDTFAGYTNDGPFYLNLRFEPAVGFAAIGSGAACCIITGLLVIGGVRSQRLGRGRAVLLLLGASALATILPFVIVRAAEVGTRPVWREPIEESLKGLRLFQGEHGWWLFIAPFYALLIALLAFVVFVVFVFRVKR